MADEETFFRERAEALHSLFNDPRWFHVVAIEQEILKDLEQQDLRLRPIFGSLEEYAKEHVYMKGKRDVFVEIWGKRDGIIAEYQEKLEAEEMKKKADDQEFLGVKK